MRPLPSATTTLPAAPVARRGRASTGFIRPGRRSGHTRAEARAGLDHRGRFVGPGDVIRGYEFFMRSRGGVVISAGNGDPRSGVVRGRAAGVSEATLVQMWRDAQAGATKREIARRHGVHYNTVITHLRGGGSPSLRRALATVKPE